VSTIDVSTSPDPTDVFLAQPWAPWAVWAVLTLAAVTAVWLVTLLVRDWYRVCQARAVRRRWRRDAVPVADLQKRRRRPGPPPPV
jgi:hypothetical protein